jgi:hypothetical protein
MVGNVCIVSPVNVVGAILVAQVDCWECMCIKEYGRNLRKGVMERLKLERYAYGKI